MVPVSCDAVEVPWDLAGRAEARDFALWLKTSKKPVRQRRPDAPAPGSVNPVTGKATPGDNYAARTRRHARAVIRSFYEYHREMHGRPLVNPFPKARGVDEAAQRPPQSDAAVPAAIAAGGVSAEGAEASPAEHPRPGVQRPVRGAGLQPGPGADRVLHLHRRPRLGAAGRSAKASWCPEEQTIGVVRKGSRALQRLPASADAFVWLRLYQQETRDLVPRGPEEPVWWTLRRPFRPLTYDAARMVFTRANRRSARTGHCTICGTAPPRGWSATRT